MNQVTTQQPANVYDVVTFQESGFNNVIADNSITWAKESQFAMQALQKNDFLNRVAWGNQASLQNAIINVAAVGISLNPALKHAYLVPRDNMVCLDVSYMGLLHLAMQGGAIEWGQAKLVYANDKYLNNGVDKAPSHSQNTFGDKGEIIGCYCTVKLKNGDYLTEEMDIAALNKVKATSKAAKGPWKTWPEEMMRKTVVKRASKYWPSCERVSTAVDIVNQHEGLASDEEIQENRNDQLKDEIEQFHFLIDNENALSLTAFLKTRHEDVIGHLYASFPKGEITKGKEAARKLNSEGHKIWQETKADIISYIAEEDAYAIKEIVEDFTNYEKKFLMELLGDKYTGDLTRLLTEEQ